MSEKKATSVKVAQAITETTKDTIAIACITAGVDNVIKENYTVGCILIATGFGLLLVDRLAHFFT